MVSLYTASPQSPSPFFGQSTLTLLIITFLYYQWASKISARSLQYSWNSFPDNLIWLQPHNNIYDVEKFLHCSSTLISVRYVQFLNESLDPLLKVSYQILLKSKHGVCTGSYAKVNSSSVSGIAINPGWSGRSSSSRIYKKCNENKSQTGYTCICKLQSSTVCLSCIMHHEYVNAHLSL